MFALFGGLLIYSTLVGHHTLATGWATVTMAALIAYTMKSQETGSRQRTWTTAGLSLLMIAALAHGTIWPAGQLLLITGGFALAVALLTDAGPPRKRRLIPAFVVAVVALAVAGKFAVAGLANGEDLTRASLVALSAIAVAAVGFAVNAALAGRRATRLAGLGLLPVLVLMIAGLFSIGQTARLDRQTAQPVQPSRPLMAPAPQEPPPVDSRNFTIYGTVAVGETTVEAAAYLVEEPWHPWSALGVTALLLGLFALVVTVVPPTGGIDLYSYRSYG